MIKEFALDPEVLATWENFRYFVEKFGVSKGRLIAEFPRRWRRLVYEAAQRRAKPVELARIVEKLKHVSDHVLLRSGRPGGDGTRPWLDRALAEHARERFSAIIAMENPAAHPDVLAQTDVHDHEPRFHVATQIEIQRTARSLTACAEVLLRNASTVKWVDPRIELRHGRWRRPLATALDLLDSRRRPVIVEVHRGYENEVHRHNLLNQFTEWFGRLSREGLSLELYLHPERSMHDRFILSDRGGIQVGHGLDDSEDGGSNPVANVLLLDQDLFDAQWSKFSDKAFRVLRI
jgi:hypothetical protein